MTSLGMIIKGIAAPLLLCAVLIAQAKAPERRVTGNLLTSERDPKVHITLPDGVKYVGAERFVLYGIADCELHIFVDADAQSRVQRLYWVQFEGYLPSHPELAHTYDSPRHTSIGGLDFFVDTWVRSTGANVTPGSDLDHTEKMVSAKGYKLPAGMMSVRLVHLLDKTTRKELMIIYSEDVSSTGFTAPDLREGGKARDRWPEIEHGLIERAERAISLK